MADNQDEAEMRYSTARGYMIACKMLFSSPQRAGREIATILPMHMLAGFALELFLKAWLLKAGLASLDVRGMGHDIKKLYRRSKEKNLPFVLGLDSVVDALAAPHGDYTFRYMNSSDKMVALGWAGTFPIFDQLDIAVDTFVGASASHGLLPGH